MSPPKDYRQGGTLQLDNSQKTLPNLAQSFVAWRAGSKLVNGSSILRLFYRDISGECDPVYRIIFWSCCGIKIRERQRASLASRRRLIAYFIIFDPILGEVVGLRCRIEYREKPDTGLIRDA